MKGEGLLSSSLAPERRIWSEKSRKIRAPGVPPRRRDRIYANGNRLVGVHEEGKLNRVVKTSKDGDAQEFREGSQKKKNS